MHELGIVSGEMGKLFLSASAILFFFPSYDYIMTFLYDGKIVAVDKK